MMTPNKRVLVIGGTGFLGYHTIKEFLQHGWQATALTLPPAPPAGLFPGNVQVVLQDVEKAADDRLLDLMHGHDALIYAAGLDDRHTLRKPAFPVFHHANVELPLRVLELARNAGVQRAIVFGSYFAHFDRLWPEMELSQHHPYIRSRTEQEQVLTSIPGIHVNILELPYIFGSLPVPGWEPLWLPIVKYLRSSRSILYMRGGTACITAHTVGRAAYAAIERGTKGMCYPIGQENLSWVEMLSRLASADGRTIRVRTIPDWLLKIGLAGFWLFHEMQGLQRGLDPRYFARLQTANTFIDPDLSSKALDYDLDDLNLAFQETISACPSKKRNRGKPQIG